MDQTVVLVPLQCIRCNTNLPAESDQVAWVCPNCGEGMYLDDETGLNALDIYYSKGVPINSIGKPYWVVEGKAAMQRETFGKSALDEAHDFWSQPRRFIIPAYRSSLEALLEQSNQYLLNPPRLDPGPATKFAPVTLDKRDINAAAEFIVVAIEASRRDRLKKIDFELELSQPVLWILPV